MKVVEDARESANLRQLQPVKFLWVT